MNRLSQAVETLFGQMSRAMLKDESQRFASMPHFLDVRPLGNRRKRLRRSERISPKLPLLAEVVAGELDGVEVSGAASVKVKGGLKVDRFTASASGAAQVSVEGVESSQAVASATGASHVVLSGSAASLKVDASGASQFKAQALQVEDARVSISGASRVALGANKSVAGEVSGASQLELYGSPARQTVSISGASQVIEKR